MANKIQLRRDHSTNWTRVNPILSDGEPGLEIDTNAIKYGDGSTAWKDLAYAKAIFEYARVQEGPAVAVTSITGNHQAGLSLTSDKWAQLMWVPDSSTVTLDDIDAGGAVYTWAYTEQGGFYIANATAPTSHEWHFDTNGDFNIPLGGDIKRDGTSVLGGNTDGGLADNSVGITITAYTLSTNLGSNDNSGAVTFNITNAGATAAGIIFKGLTVDHTQTRTSDTFVQGNNTVSWNYEGMDGAFWNQVVSVTAYVVDSRGYTFHALVTDAWEVPAGPCFVEGTMITMANGSHKKIEDITHGELVRVWNFDLGEFTEAQPLWIKVAEETTEHGVYTFSDGTQLRTVGHHVFNKQAGAFTKLKLAETPIGTTTFNERGEEVTLVSKQRVVEPTRYYNVWTQYHLNLFADGILTSNRFNNIYPIVDMKFVKDDRPLRSVDEFAGIDEKYITGLRLQEQTYSLEYISNYVHNRLERLDIANNVEQGI